VSDQKRDQAAPLDAGFERFVVSASPALLRSAYLLTGDHGHAEDLLQSALARTLGRWHAISGSPTAYVFAVLVNLSHDHRRAQRRRPLTALDRGVPDRPAADQLDRVLERDAITQAAGCLPRSQREVLACRFVLDLSVAETAATLGLPEGTVKSYAARAHVFSAGWVEIVLWLASCATVNSTNAAIVFSAVEIGHGHVPVSASAVDVVQSPAPPANSASVGPAARGTGSCGFGIRLMVSICAE
jgi:RNA polymerase sigma-70 factor (sigma-E family)